MSTEARKTNEFLKALRADAPDAVITKYNDRLTSGIPDASCTYHGRTVWMEFKMWPLTQYFTPHYPAAAHVALRRTNKHARLQLLSLGRYYVASGGRAFLIFFHGDGTPVYRVCQSRTTSDLSLVTLGTPDDVRAFILQCCKK